MKSMLSVIWINIWNYDDDADNLWALEKNKRAIQISFGQKQKAKCLLFLKYKINSI